MSATASPPGLRISLRELLIVVTAVVISCAGLKYANPWWAGAAIAITLLTFIRSTIVATLDKGPRRAAALGFTLASGVYVVLLFSMLGQFADSGSQLQRNPEFHLDGRLPTSQVLGNCFEAVVKYFNVDIRTGNQTPYTAKGLSPRQIGNFGASFKEVPDRTAFMTVGQCLWALLFGYAGGHFARWVYLRRLREQRNHSIQ